MVELGSKKRLKYLFLVFLAIVSLFLVPTVAYYYYPTTYCQYNWDPYDPTVLPDWNDPADIARGQANPEAPMEGGKKAPECTFLKINAYDPEGTVKSQSDTSTAQCNIYYTAVCSDDTAGFWHEHGTATVAGSTRYFTNPFELQWSVMNTVCAIGGLEGYYDFEFLSDGGAMGNTYSDCVFLEDLEVQWDLDENWCILSSCGKGEWSSGLGCCSPREMGFDGPNFPSSSGASQYYTNEDCNKGSGTSTLCYFSRNPQWESVSSDAEWLSASTLEGEVVYEGCGDVESTTDEDGYEYLATGSIWRQCSTSDWQQTITASVSGRTVSHEFICVTSVSPQEYSIAECNHDSTKAGYDMYDQHSYPGGMIGRGGQSINTSNSNVYFCNNQSKWSTDLDSYSLAGDAGEYCDRAKFPPNDYAESLSGSNMKYQGIDTEWTGSYCCGETDDWENQHPDRSFTIGNEYYNDPDNVTDYKSGSNPGTCFNNWHQDNESFLTIYDKTDNDARELKEVMIWHGTFQGCAINHNDALTNKEDSGWNNPGFIHENIDCSSSRSDANKPYEGSIGELSNFETKYGFSESAIVDSGGSVNPPVSDCYDSDGGIVPTESGFVSCSGVSGGLPLYDYCTGPQCQWEFFCNADKNIVKRFHCYNTNSCSGGAFAPGTPYRTYPNYDEVFDCTTGASLGVTGNAVAQSGTFTASASNDFLLLLEDKPNPGGGGTKKRDLIYDNEYCNIKNWTDGSSYFCSYNETWMAQDISKPRTHLSFIPWLNSSLQQAECCQPTECWNGTNCLTSATETFAVVPHKAMNSRGDGFVCKDGDWDWSYKKTSWDGDEIGYCLENTQCLVSVGGEYSLTNEHGPLHYPVDEISSVRTPACINDGEFYLDHYCENGTWTTRTKFVALELYDLVKSGKDFTLYCDSYDKVLNKYDYILENDFSTVEQKYFQSNPSSKCLSYDGASVPCANHVCVLLEDPQGSNPKIYFGTSLNYRLNTTTSVGDTITTYDIGDALGTSLAGCAQYEGNTDSFKKCASGDEVYYNGKKSIAIFSRQSITVDASYFNTLKNLFLNFIETLIAWITNTASSGYDYDMIEELADQLYHDYEGYGYETPNFECDLNGGCVGDSQNGKFPSEVCGEMSNPRKVYDLNTLYLSKIGNRKIFGMAELEADSSLVPTRYYGILFSGFNDDICGAFNSAITGYKCENVAGKTYTITASTTTPFVEISYDSLVDISSWEQWVFLTASTRIQE